MFGRGSAPTRAQLLDRADKARAKGRKKKAIIEYRKALALDPADATVHSKVAPLLATTGQRAEAMKSFRFAAEAHLKAGFVDRAIAVWVSAANFFPDEEPLWNEVAKLQLQRGRKADAVKALIDAHRHFRGKKRRDTAIGFLKQAVGLEPMNVQANLLLARLLKKAGRMPEAKSLLTQLSTQIRGPALRQIRRAQFNLSPTPAALWRWMRGQ